MFTLDRMTLFFFSLSESYREADSISEQSALINNWSAKVVTGQPRRGKGTASDASTPTLTSGSSKVSKGSKAPASSRTALNNKVKIRVNEDDDVNSYGAFSDKDERNGAERIRAQASPPKGKGNRATSSVCDPCRFNIQILLIHT